MQVEITSQFEQVRCMIEQGYLPLLASDLGGLEGYWKQLLLDFPDHPAHGREAQSIPLTLYGLLIVNGTVFDMCGTRIEIIWVICKLSFSFCHPGPQKNIR